LAWIESFYQITADREIADDARPRSFQRADSAALPNVLRNKLFKIFATAKPAVKPLAKREPKPPAYLARVPGVERNVALGLELLKLRSAIQNNREYGQQLRRQFEIETKLAVDALKVARLYGARPEIFTRLSWNALVHRASPALPAATREALERRIPAGEHIGAPEIRAARGALKAGKWGRQADQRAQQMVA
jgi:hypothetical protein